MIEENISLKYPKPTLHPPKQARDTGNAESRHLKTSYINASDTKTQILPNFWFWFPDLAVSAVPCLIFVCWSKGCPDYPKDPSLWVMDIVGLKLISWNRF